MADIPSTVVAVIVFTDRARVTRRGQLTLEPGTHRLQFPDLPANLDPASLRVAARGTAPAKLLGVDGHKTFFTAPPVPRLRELEDLLQSLQDSDAADADWAATLAKQLTHLDGLSDAARIYAYGLANGKMTLDQQAGVLAFLEQQRGSLQERTRTITAQRRERARQIDKVQQEIRELQAPQARQGYAVTVELAAGAPGDFAIDVTYVLPNAGWRPLYDMRLLGDELEITYLAEIQQHSGEDWKGVSLTLSTARPALAAAIPRLQPWYLHPRHEPRPVAASAAKGGAWRSAGAHSEPVMTLAAPAAPPAMAAAEVETARVEGSGAAVNFQIAGALDVPSDNAPHKATVGIFRLRPQLDFVCVPKLAEAVFRRVKVPNASAFTLLPGRAQLFLADDYLGASDVKLTAPGQIFELFFGADDRLRVQRGTTRRDVGKSFLGGKRRLHYAYEIRLWNHTDAAQKLTVVDQVPLPQHEDIKVTVDSAEPKPSRQDDLNIMIWNLVVAPGGDQKINYAFTIEHPRELALTGLG